MRLAYRPTRVSGLMASTGSSASGATCCRTGRLRGEDRAARSESIAAAARPGRASRLLTAAARPCRARQLFAAGTRSVHHRQRQCGRSAMRLSGRERQVLDLIGEGLARSDPHLVGLLVTFTRLASGEEMPLREKLAANPRRALRRPSAPRCRSGRSRPRCRFMLQRPGFLHAAALMYVLMMVALVVSAMVLNRGGSHRACPSLWAAPCVKTASAPGSRPAAHRRPVGEGDTRYTNEGARP